MNNIDYNSIPQIEWARLAAYVDSEGCIRIVKGCGAERTNVSKDEGVKANRLRPARSHCPIREN
jgi:hypothetical protein